MNRGMLDLLIWTIPQGGNSFSLIKDSLTFMLSVSDNCSKDNLLTICKYITNSMCNTRSLDIILASYMKLVLSKIS